jgi:hypothetical protein
MIQYLSLSSVDEVNRGHPIVPILFPSVDMIDFQFSNCGRWVSFDRPNPLNALMGFVLQVCHFKMQFLGKCIFLVKNNHTPNSDKAQR